MICVYGEDSAASTVFVAPTLTGTSRVMEWWPGLVGSGRLFDPARWRIVGIDIPGDPGTTLRNIVADQRRLLAQHGIERLDVILGASLGGMQALQWAVDAPELVGHAVVIGAHDHQSAMAIAFNAVQREAIALDATRGLRLARKIAMITYKSDALLRARHDRRLDRNGLACFDVEGYLEHQADVFEGRFQAARYAALTAIMDSFDVRESAKRHTGRLRTQLPKVTFIAQSSDLLFRPEDVYSAFQRFKVNGYDAEYFVLTSDHGHDAFLAEGDKLDTLLRSGTLAASVDCGGLGPRSNRGSDETSPRADPGIA